MGVSTQIEDFDSMNDNSVANIPAGFKVSTGSDYASGTATTTQSGGISGGGALSETSIGGTYNFANGNNFAPDRALGFLTSLSYPGPRNIFLQMNNSTGSTITELLVTFRIEKYRYGKQEFDINFYDGQDGTTWTSQPTGNQNYPADTNNEVANSFITKTVTITGLSIASGGNYYLRWEYAGLIGSDDSQALGIDDVKVKATTMSTTVAPTSLTIANVTADRMQLTWTKPTGTQGLDWDGVVLFARAGGSPNDASVSGTDGIFYKSESNLYGLGTTNNNSYCVANVTSDTDGNVIVTGLSPGTQYDFVAYTYKTVSGTGDDIWSANSYPVYRSPNVQNITNLLPTPSNAQVGLNWTNTSGIAGGTWWDEVLIIASSSTISFSPTNDGSAYTPNTVYGNGTAVAPNQFAVYKGTGISTTVTGLTNGVAYNFKVFVRKGTYWSSGVTASANPFAATKKWDGDGQLANTDWNKAANWAPNGVPTNTEMVLLDNSILAGSYDIILPNTAVTVNRLTISPAINNKITLTLPITNTLTTAFTVGDNVAGTGDIIINNGGVLKNLSGASSGTPLSVIGNTDTDVASFGTFRINNGGRYIHNTIRAHTNGLVDALSTATGTELGVFEFKNPDASVTISLNGRTYGTLELSQGVTSTTTYSGNGTKDLSIRGNLIVNPNAVFKPGLTSRYVITGNIVVNGVWEPNPASGSTNINLSGTSTQTISGSGTINLNAGGGTKLFINNAAGVSLSKSITLTPGATAGTGSLDFTTGHLILGTSDLKITGDIFGADATKFIVTNSVKTDVTGFLIQDASAGKWFPIGSTASADHYTPAFVTADASENNPIYKARVFNKVYDNGTGNSDVEHSEDVVKKTWHILPESGNGIANISLQWNEANEGAGFTYIRLNSAQWLNISGTLSSSTWASLNTTPVAGTDPFSLSTNDVSSATYTFFTAYNDPFEPLPLSLLSFEGKRLGNSIKLDWTTTAEINSKGFEVQRSADLKTFVSIGFVQATQPGQAKNDYTFTDENFIQASYYRLKQIDLDGQYEYIKPIFVEGNLSIPIEGLLLYPNPTEGSVHLALPDNIAEAHLKLVSANGITLAEFTASAETVDAKLSEHLSLLPAGLYLVQTTQGNQTYRNKLLKR
jgi:hypothetical protein